MKTLRKTAAGLLLGVALLFCEPCPVFAAEGQAVLDKQAAELILNQLKGLRDIMEIMNEKMSNPDATDSEKEKQEKRLAQAEKKLVSLEKKLSKHIEDNRKIHETDPGTVDFVRSEKKREKNLKHGGDQHGPRLLALSSRG